MKHRISTLSLLACCCGLTTSLFEAQRNMKVRSPIFDEISGKLGGAVGMTTANGMILRSLVTPANPDTSFQNAVRNILTSLASVWANTLTAPQRQSWEDLADLTPGGGSGISLFVKGNSELRRAGAAYVATAPASAATIVTAPTAVSVDVSDARTNLTFPAAGADPWQTAGGWTNIYVSRQQPATRTTCIHPFRLWSSLEGDVAFGAKTSAKPADVTITAGKVVYVKTTYTTADGRRGHDNLQRITIQA